MVRFIGWILIASAVAAGCSNGSGVVEAARLEVSSCDSVGEPRVFEPFAMPLTFLGVTREGDRVVMRAAEASRWAPDGDQFVVTIESLSDVREEIRATGEAVRPLGVDTAVRVGLSLHQSCDAVTDALVATGGEARFQKLGTTKGSRVVAQFTFDLGEMRSGQPAASGALATLDFEVGVGAPYQTFSDPSGTVGEEVDR